MVEVIKMANEEKKDFNKMLKDSKDMPKIQVITDEKSIQKYSNRLRSPLFSVYRRLYRFFRGGKHRPG